MGIWIDRLSSSRPRRAVRDSHGRCRVVGAFGKPCKRRPSHAIQGRRRERSLRLALQPQRRHRKCGRHRGGSRCLFYRDCVARPYCRRSHGRPVPLVGHADRASGVGRNATLCRSRDRRVRSGSTMQNTSHQTNALYLAWLIALTATLGALFIGEVMGRTPCVLCWYQRIAMFPLALILGLASFRADHAVRHYVIPLALIGGLIALWHSLLFVGIIPEPIQPCERNGPSCSGEDQVLFGVLPLPYLSVFSFSAIILLLTVPFRKRSS